MNNPVGASGPSSGACDVNVKLARELMDACNAHDIERIERFYHPDYEGHDVSEATDHHGPSDIRRFMATILEAFPDLEFEVERCIAQHNAVSLFWVARGTHQGRMMNIPATGRRIKTRGAAHLEVSEGKIIRGLQVWDVAGMLRAIGLLPDLAH